MNGVPSYKFCFEGCYIETIEMPQVLATTCQNMGSLDDIVL